jgi:hypothetical protein
LSAELGLPIPIICNSLEVDVWRSYAMWVQAWQNSPVADFFIWPLAPPHGLYLVRVEY